MDNTKKSIPSLDQISIVLAIFYGTCLPLGFFISIFFFDNPKHILIPTLGALFLNGTLLAGFILSVISIKKRLSYFTLILPLFLIVVVYFSLLGLQKKKYSDAWSNDDIYECPDNIKFTLLEGSLLINNDSGSISDAGYLNNKTLRFADMTPEKQKALENALVPGNCPNKKDETLSDHVDTVLLRSGETKVIL